MTMQTAGSTIALQETATIYTIGYEKRTIDEYLELLVANGVSLVVDVRKNPLSRKRGFSKKSMGLALDAVGIGYQHIPELGIESSLRRNLSAPEDYRALFEHYEREILPVNESSLRTIEGLLDKFDRIALTCFELAPESCHRHCVAKTFEDRFTVVNL